MTTKISDSTNVQMPMKTVVSLIALVSVFTYSYFLIQESINTLSVKAALMERDMKNHVTSLTKQIEKNTKFRIERPQSPSTKESFMLIEHLAKEQEAFAKTVARRADQNSNNKVNITRLQEDMLEVRAAVEKLKDAQRHLQITGK
mgnify:FL=1|tara:strand:+ start:2856 stop:3290 length:435 start_codon:yes stop_codon:yes gene_type:complete